MKRKLVLVFEDNQLLTASLTERGKRHRFQPITSSIGAIKEVGAALKSAAETLSRVPAATVPAATVPAATLPPSVPKETEETMASIGLDESRPKSVCARPKVEATATVATILGNNAVGDW